MSSESRLQYCIWVWLLLHYIACEKQYCLSEHRGLWGGHTTLFVPLTFIHTLFKCGRSSLVNSHHIKSCDHIKRMQTLNLQDCSCAEKSSFFKKMLQNATSYHECCSVRRNVTCSRLVWPQHYSKILKCAFGINSQSKEATGDKLWRSV